MDVETSMSVVKGIMALVLLVAGANSLWKVFSIRQFRHGVTGKPYREEDVYPVRWYHRLFLFAFGMLAILASIWYFVSLGTAK